MNTQTIHTAPTGPLTKFADLNLVAPLMEAVAESGYVTPTPIQAQSIPHLLEGHDLLGLAQTGTGKTAAFVLPMLQRMMEHRKQAQPKSMRALILTPTRELAVQIADSIKTYGRHLPLRSTVIFGGVGQAPQVEKMRRGIDFVVATPGRLLDLMNQGHVTLTSVEFFVLDEADRMLDMGFIRDIRKITAVLPTRRQTLLFSATMPKDVAELANSLLTKPKRVEVVPQSTTAERIDQLIYLVPKANKRRLLADLLQAPDVARAIVFTRTKRGADKVSEYLERNGHTSAAIHGNKGQNARQQALAAFRNGTVKVLVATDIAARGIDIDGISHVINFELPLEPESYVHRIGRTARAGNAGVALSLCDSEERSLLRDIEKIVRMKLPVVDDHPLAVAASDGTDGAEQVTLQRAQQIREKRERQQPRKPQQGRSNSSQRDGQRNGQRNDRRNNRRDDARGRDVQADGQERQARPQQPRREERPQRRPHDGRSQRMAEDATPGGESRFEAELRRAQAARGNGRSERQQAPVRQGGERQSGERQSNERRGSDRGRIDYRSRAEEVASGNSGQQRSRRR
ncbi:ATP-dependent RNA helicase RhlE [Dongia mobilis]|uniref:DEAD-box ATP-dependent RNA helicase RhpA n=1 Tax=Dongia mobilis TaxID=578943 RepID=A0A4R6WWD8_9PROT|nr:DEAD/DEAH box helicase [Dongia mobilis]TDQ84510.1 ATP-dependent RNA helicase RhlE [Dongia mobilis]